MTFMILESSANNNINDEILTWEVIYIYSGTSLIRSSKMRTPPSTGHHQESSCFCFVCFCQINLGGASGLVARAHGDYHTILGATLYRFSFTGFHY